MDDEALTPPRARSLLRSALSALYAAAGLLHLWSPEAFLPIVPLWVPMPREVVLVTGLCELAGAAGLLIPRLRRISGIMLALYAACVFPANIRHAVEGIQVAGLPSTWWYHAPRLALQPVIVWAALFCSAATSWPFRSTSRRSHPHD
ncbi:DoxX family protein [uncultured Alsobacter sp.]|uniref:DoxX family protein n=1 Tax=uncultured Alsobacter sp. TaxID=1748258 RepID=UPI0025DA9D3A|nr:DoxX family protein [uncultured Alsobacter sp.]